MTFPANPQIINEVAVNHINGGYMLTVSNCARIVNWKAISDVCETHGWKVSTYSTSVHPHGLARIEGVHTIGSMAEGELKSLADALDLLKVAIETEMAILPEDAMFKK